MVDVSPKSSAAMHDPWRPAFAKIVGIREEIDRVRSFELEVDSEFRFSAGQFNMIYLPGYGESAISISSAPGTRDSLVHTVRRAGNVTSALFKKKTGDQIGLRGPFGSFWPLESYRGWNVVIAAGGIGLAPLRPAIYEIMKHRDRYDRVRLVYGARRPADLLYVDEFDQWRQAGIEVELTVDLGDDQWQGQIGVVPTLLERISWLDGRTTLWTCGPEIMMRFVLQHAVSAGISPEHLHLSMERNMNCAMGICGHCQLGPTFVCKDGPVFSYPQMQPYLFVEDF